MAYYWSLYNTDLSADGVNPIIIGFPVSRTPFINTDQLESKQEEVMTGLIKFGRCYFIHSQSSAVVSLQLEIYKYINSFIPHFVMDVITHPFWE